MSESLIQPKITTMHLFVPRSTKLAFIKNGSAIVGVSAGDRLFCSYEGGLYSEMHWVDMLTSACWRLSERSPSVAYISPKPDAVSHVADVSWDETLRAWVLTEIYNGPALSEWIGSTPVIGGTRAQHQRAAGLILNNQENKGAMAAFERARLQNRDPVDAVITYARSCR